jgi:hypothetical protein
VDFRRGVGRRQIVRIHWGSRSVEASIIHAS